MGLSFSEDELIAQAAKNVGYQVAPDGFLIHPDTVDEEESQRIYNAEYNRLLGMGVKR